MNDKYFFACFIYLVIASTLMGVMPDSFFSGSSGTIPTLNTDDIDGSVSAFTKIAKFLFVPFAIAGIPTLIGVIIGFINLMCAIVGSIYIYDKLRGIGS